MRENRVAKEAVGYVIGIFVMGALSKGINLVEGKRNLKKEKEKQREDSKWHLEEKKVRTKEGRIETELILAKTITKEEYQEMLDYSEYVEELKNGYVVMRAVPAKEKKKVDVKGVMKNVGKGVGDIFFEGVKKRAVFEMRDRSRNIAKDSKDTEIFLKNNIFNRFRKSEPMY